MKQFPLIFRHFLFRSFRDPMSIIFFLLLPMGLIILNTVISFAQMEELGDGRVVEQATAMVTLFMLAFQFFSSDILIYNVYDDIRGTVRPRLLASPVAPQLFFFGAMASSWVFNLVQAALILGVSALFLDLSFGVIWVLLVTVLLVSMIAQLIALLLTQVAKTRKVASGVLQGLCFLFMLLSGVLFIPLGDSAVAQFVMQYGSPLGVAWHTLMYSGVIETDMNQVFLNLGILGGMVAVLLVAVFAVKGRINA